MVRRSAFKQADIARAIKGAKSAGMKPSGCRIDPTTGAIELMFGSEAACSSDNSFDQIMARSR